MSISSGKIWFRPLFEMIQFDIDSMEIVCQDMSKEKMPRFSANLKETWIIAVWCNRAKEIYSNADADKTMEK